MANIAPPHPFPPSKIKNAVLDSIYDFGSNPVEDSDPIDDFIEESLPEVNRERDKYACC